MADYGVKITLAALSPIPAYTGGIWANGAAWLCSGEAPTVDWINGALVSVSAIGERVDVARGGNYAETSDATVTIESTHWKAFDAAGASIYGASVVVGQLAGDGTFSPRWSGVVREPEWAGAVLTLSVESVNTLRHREIPARIITAAEFPNLPTSSEGACVPIIYGACERMRPPVLESNEFPLPGIRIWTGAGIYSDSPRTYLKTNDFSGEEKNYTIVYRVGIGGAYGSKVGTWAEDIADPEAFIYLRISSGTGAGQVRRISFFADVAADTSVNSVYSVAVTTETPLDTDPDLTSEFEIYRKDRVARLAVGDEAHDVATFAASGGEAVRVASEIFDQDGIAIADLSSEFASGDAVDALLKIAPQNVFGRSHISDGISASGVNAYHGGARTSFITGTGQISYFEFANMAYNDYTAFSGINAKSLYMLFSFKRLDAYYDRRASCVIQDFNGNVTHIYHDGDLPDDDYRFSGWLDGSPGAVANAFSPSLEADGAAGNFKKFAKLVGFPVSKIWKIWYGVLRDDFQNDAFFNSFDVFGDYVQGSNYITITNDNNIDIGASITASHMAMPTVGYSQSPVVQVSSTRWVVSAGLWVFVSSFDGVTNRLYLSSTPDWASGSFRFNLATYVLESAIGRTEERESALCVSFGDVSLDGGVLVSCNSGRSYNLAHWPSIPPGEDDGNRIIVAKHAATDIMYRDLGLVTGDVDQSSFDALESSAITALIYERESSRDILAQIADEFGWIFAHDLQGRERAAKFMERIGSTSYDYDVTTADMIRETVTGLQATAIEDVVTLPTFSGDWTQADGYRLSYGVSDLGIPPDDLDSDNFRQYVFGYWDELNADTRNFYRKFYEGFQLSGVRQSGEIPIRFHLGNPGYDMMLARASWISRRKPIIEFSILETSAKAAALVGDRMRVTHRRYLQSGAIGTVVARYWNPEAGSVQYTVMLDPAPITGGETEGGWNFNWGNDWGEHT